MNKKLFLVLAFLAFVNNIYGSDYQVLEFNNKPIVDVLAVLADLSDINIIADNSVKGTCSYYFTTENMEEALDLFLKSQNLYMSKLDSAYVVSKIFIEVDDAGFIDLSTTETDIKLIIDKVSKIAGVTILYDNLPRTTISLNSSDLSVKTILEIIMKRFPDYKLEETKDYYYIKKEPVIQNNSGFNSGTNKTNGIKRSDNGLYTINLNKSRFSQIIAELFEKEGQEYSIQGRNDNIIDRLDYKDKTFIEMLNLILESGSCDYVISNDIYYIFDINKTEVANKHIETQVIKLDNITTKELLKLMPGTFMSNNSLKVDDNTNSVIVYGTKIKTAPIINFIELIDKDQKRKPYIITMDFESSDLLKNILLKTYSSESIINIDKDSFIILLTEDEYKEVTEIKNRVDKAPNSHKVTLKYIQSKDLLDNLPKSVESDQIISTPNPAVIFFYGEEEGYKTFLKELEHIDKPTPQLKYKVLIVEDNLDKGSEFGISYGTSAWDKNANNPAGLTDDNWMSYSGVLGSLLDLNFNVLSTLGPLYSINLDAKLNEGKAKIHVDSTLTGLSGKKVTFRNTKTSRFYTEQETTSSDGQTTSTTTGAAQEVSWGIILDIEGWTSGDGMVTVSVQSTISDQTNVSGQTSGIPATSEKIVNTHVRTREGNPVIIGGLKNTTLKKDIIKTPILGSIPFLGRLFRKEITSELNSEFTIYLIPYIENDGKENLSVKLKNIYEEYRN